MNYSEEQAIRKIAREERDGFVAFAFSIAVIFFLLCVIADRYNELKDKNHALEYRVKRIEQRVFHK